MSWPLFFHFQSVVHLESHLQSNRSIIHSSGHRIKWIAPLLADAQVPVADDFDFELEPAPFVMPPPPPGPERNPFEWFFVINRRPLIR